MGDRADSLVSNLIERHHVKVKFVVVGAWNTL
jgi:hypothetical protein